MPVSEVETNEVCLLEYCTFNYSFEFVPFLFSRVYLSIIYLFIDVRTFIPPSFRGKNFTYYSAAFLQKKVAHFKSSTDMSA